MTNEEEHLLVSAVFSEHAVQQMARRGIDEDTARATLRSPEQEGWARPGRRVFQSRHEEPGSGKRFLLRVFLDVDRTPPVVVTVYRSSKIQRYWSAV